MVLFKIRENDIQGGSIQFFFSKNIHRSVEESVYETYQKEYEASL
jgi:hypothetical protein